MVLQLKENPLFKLGPNNEYILDDRAKRHIIEGDFAKRIIVDVTGKRGSEDVISGGLHTWAAWTTFLRKHPGFVHLADFDAALHKGWYFARELQNGTIALKIPRELFSGAAADITLLPDVHLKSGYLWKTLFPTALTDDEIVGVIREALENISHEESSLGAQSSIVIGYARLSDPLTAMRIRIQLEGNEIRSAFPSWDQPASGNNGKPYSPEHSIMFSIAASTIGATRQSVRTSRLLKQTGKLDLAELMRMTPQFLCGRTYPKYGEASDQWRTQRIAEIEAYSADCGNAEITHVENYLKDFCISKEPFVLQVFLQPEYIGPVFKHTALSNLTMVMQNVVDCFTLLLHTDNRLSERRFIECATRHLSMAVIHTGILNMFEYKRLLKLIMRCAVAHHAKDSTKIIVESITRSPIRGALYSEVNINPFYKTDDFAGHMTIGRDGLEAPIVSGLVYDWAATNLGENYLNVFTLEQRISIAKRVVTQNVTQNFVESSLRYFIGSDFDFFAQFLDELTELSETKMMPDESSMVELIREYDRMLLTYRQRIVLEDLEAYQAEVDHSLAGTPEFFKLIKQKHKRTYVIHSHELALKLMGEFAAKLSYVRLSKRVDNLKKKMGMERIPLPHAVPQRLRKWQPALALPIDIEAYVKDPFHMGDGKH